MSSNMILFGRNRSLPGREHLSAAHFGEFAQYLGGLQQSGAIGVRGRLPQHPWEI